MLKKEEQNVPYTHIKKYKSDNSVPSSHNRFISHSLIVIKYRECATKFKK